MWYPSLCLCKNLNATDHIVELLKFKKCDVFCHTRYIPRVLDGGCLGVNVSFSSQQISSQMSAEYHIFVSAPEVRLMIQYPFKLRFSFVVCRLLPWYITKYKNKHSACGRKTHSKHCQHQALEQVLKVSLIRGQLSFQATDSTKNRWKTFCLKILFLKTTHYENVDNVKYYTSSHA
jgi:hypothetical protein